MSDSYSVALDNVRNLIAASATWQAWCGASTAAIAATKIHLHAIDTTDIQMARPFVIVMQGDTREWNFTGTQAWGEVGSAIVHIEANMPDELREIHGAAASWFYERVGAIVDEMLALSGTTGYINATQISQLVAPQRSAAEDAETLGHYLAMQLGVSWST